MSVWKKFQRVGRKAAKFQFIASCTELKLETNNFQPEKLIIAWVHRNRRYSCEPIELVELQRGTGNYSYVWSMPSNLEIVTTLYKMKKQTNFEEKDWTFQLEETRFDGKSKRLLAYRNVNLADYAEVTSQQHQLKISFKLSSKKIKSATLYLTISSVLLKEGDATDDDMISMASLMSHNPSFCDVGRLSDLSDMLSQLDENQQANFQEDDNDLHTVSNPTNHSQVLTRASTNQTTDPHLANQLSQLCYDINQLNHQDNQPNDVGKLDRTESSLVSTSSNQLTLAPTTTSTNQSPTNRGEELLAWCRSVTKNYPNIDINDFSDSFRNGLAFCAIIHHFHPELIDYGSLQASNAKHNNSTAFSICATNLGIPKVLDAHEMHAPDPLSIMTYLHQLQTHFTHNDFVLSPTSASYKKSPSPPTLTPTTHLHTPQDDVNITHVPSGDDSLVTTQTTTMFPEFGDLPKSIKDFTGKPTIESNDQKYSSEDKDSPKHNNLSIPRKSLPSNTKQNSSKIKLSSFNIDGSVKEESFISDKKIKPIKIGQIQNLSNADQSLNNQTLKHPLNAAQKEDLDSQETNIQNPTKSYIAAELEALEREQEKIDEEAARVEPLLREAMVRGGAKKHQEASLLAQWFDLVNKKNALIRRNMQLQFLEKEKNLERRFNLLQDELRQILSMEDNAKTKELKYREELLMRDLIEIINQRDNVVHELDKYEQGLANELEFARSHPEVFSEANYQSVTKQIHDSRRYNNADGSKPCNVM